MSAYRIIYKVPTASGSHRTTSIDVTPAEIKGIMQQIKAADGYELVEVQRGTGSGFLQEFKTIRTF